MPKNVYIKTRLRVDPEALTTRRMTIEQALAAAAGRALKKSRDVVLTGLGAGVEVRLNPPQVNWTGPALEKVSKPLRAEVEMRIAAVLAAAAEAAGLARPVPVRTAAVAMPPPTQADPFAVSEPFDAARFDADSETYEVPSYQHNQPPKKLPAREEAKHQEPTEHRTLVTFSTLDEVEASISEAYRKVTPDGNTFYGVYGIWGPTQMPTLFWCIGLVEEGEAKGSLWYTTMSLVRVDLKEGKVLQYLGGNQPMRVRFGGHYRLEGLWTLKVYQGAPYSVILRDEANWRGDPVFLPDDNNRQLRGKLIRFWVPFRVVQVEPEVGVKGLKPGSAARLAELRALQEGARLRQPHSQR